MIATAGCDSSCGRTPEKAKAPAPAAAEARRPANERKPGVTRVCYSLEDGEVVSGELAEVLQRTDLLATHGLKAEFLPFKDASKIELGGCDVAFIVPGVMHQVAAVSDQIAVVAPLWFAGFNTLAVLPGSKVRTLPDLAGKQIETVMNPVLFRAVLASYGMTPKQLTYTSSFRTPEELLVDLQAGKLDAAAFWSPWLETYSNRAQIRVVEGPPFLSFVVMQRDFITRDAAAATRFAMALLEAAAWLPPNREQVHRWYSKRSGLGYRFLRDNERSADLYKSARFRPAAEDALTRWDVNASYLEGVLLDGFTFENYYERGQKVAHETGKVLARPLAHRYVPDIAPFLEPAVLEKARAEVRRRGRIEVRVMDAEPPSAPEALRKGLASADEGARVEALEAAVRERRAELKAEILPLLADASEEVRAAAARAAGRLALDGAQAPLEKLLADKSPIVVESAIEAASQLDPARFKPVLLERLKHPVAAARLIAVESVAASYASDPAALDAILPLLHDADPRVRYEAAWSLTLAAPNDTARAKRIVAELLKNERLTMLEQALPGLLLSSFPDARAELPWLELTKKLTRNVVGLRLETELPPQQALPIFAEMTKSPDRYRRIHGLFGMCKVAQRAPAPSAAALDEAMKGALNDPEANVRRAALEMAGHFKLAVPGEVVLAQLRDPEPLVRAAAAYAATELKVEAAAGALLPLLDDRAPLVRETAARGLGKLGAKQAAPRLQALAGDASPGVSEMARWALGQLGSP